MTLTEMERIDSLFEKIDNLLEEKYPLETTIKNHSTTVAVNSIHSTILPDSINIVNGDTPITNVSSPTVNGYSGNFLVGWNLGLGL